MVSRRAMTTGRAVCAGGALIIGALPPLRSPVPSPLRSRCTAPWVLRTSRWHSLCSWVEKAEWNNRSAPRLGRPRGATLRSRLSPCNHEKERRDETVDALVDGGTLYCNTGGGPADPRSTARDATIG